MSRKVLMLPIQIACKRHTKIICLEQGPWLKKGLVSTLVAVLNKADTNNFSSPARKH